MPALNFPDLPDMARVWIYGAIQSLTPEQVLALDDHMARFLAQWHSHERPVTPSWQLMHDRFVVIGADESAAGLSGCSIDSMVRNLKDFAGTTGLDFLGTASQVFYRDRAGAVQCVDRPGFAKLAEQGAVDEQTMVFNNVIATVGEFRAGRWEVPLSDSWHMQAFGRNLALASGPPSPSQTPA